MYHLDYMVWLHHGPKLPDSHQYGQEEKWDGCAPVSDQVGFCKNISFSYFLSSIVSSIGV